jgi:CheY-like chemotaxis protein
MDILVVDDVPMVRTRIAALLREVSPSLRVVEAGDANEAFGIVRDVAPDVIILDVHLPGPSGLQMLPRLTRGECPPIVIVLTNDASEQHRRQCLALGARHFFDKSIDFDQLVEVVASLVTPPRPNGA